MNTPPIAYPELDQSSLVLFDMAAFYLPLQDRDWPDYFPCQALLATVEALIYQVEIAIDQDRPWNWPDQAARIRAFLADHGELNASIEPQINDHLEDIGRYFTQVARLRTQSDADVASILTTAELRPSDIRLLHCLLLQRLGRPYEPELFDALVPLEVLVDLKANLSEYEVDVVGNYHNTYHALVRAVGAEAPRLMAEHLATWQAEYAHRLAKAPFELRRRIEAFAERHEHVYPSVAIPKPHFPTSI